MAISSLIGIVPGDPWRGNGGMGPNVRIKGIDLKTAEVHYDYVPADREHPSGKSDIRTFLKNFEPVA